MYIRAHHRSAILSHLLPSTANLTHHLFQPDIKSIIMNVDAKLALEERIINYTFTDKVLGAGTLQMAAPTVYLQVNGNMHSIPKNSDLAVLGDSVLATVLCKMWYEYRNAQGMQHPSSALNLAGVEYAQDSASPKMTGPKFATGRPPTIVSARVVSQWDSTNASSATLVLL